MLSLPPANYEKETQGQRRNFTVQTWCVTARRLARVSETLVSYSDIQTLPDLSCYVTLPGPYPAVKLALKYKSRPKIAEGFILRNLDTRTDARLDTLLEAREAESSHAPDAVYARCTGA